ncbi:MAG: GNAT family N-acetyltransferase [bacterium]
MAQRVRRWTLNDLTTIQDVLWMTWVKSYSSFIPETDLKSYFSEHYDLDSVKKLFNNPTVDGFVAEVEGKVVGFMRTIHDSEENRYYVSSLYVLPDYQSMGLGIEFMKVAAGEAKKFNLNKIWVGVMVQNTQALDWYKKMGYVSTRIEPFTMGNSTVGHHIGYVPVEKLLESK